MYYVIVSSKKFMGDFENKIIGSYKTESEAKVRLFVHCANFLGWENPADAPADLLCGYRDGHFNVDWMSNSDDPLADRLLEDGLFDYELYRVEIVKY